MNWIELTQENQIETIKQESRQHPVIIFKHSTRCATSAMAKNRLEREESPANTKFYFLDLIKHRSISNKISEDFAVHHESPQVLLIKNEECTYDESHNGISMQDIWEQLN